jgi:hypothetical protein
VKGKVIIDQNIVEAAITGGAVLAGGEGGSIEYGRRLGNLAVQLGKPYLIDIDNLSENARLIGVSVVGASAPKERYLEPIYHVRAIEKFISYTGLKINAIITNASGGTSTVNGWLQSVVLGIPVVDATCNGRNSPTSIPGSMGLHRQAEYDSIQVGVGGNPETGSFIEVFTRGSLFKTTNVIRQAAIEAGGAVAVARNPVSASYAKKNAAIGGVSKAIDIGKKVLACNGKCMEVVDCICSFLKGNVVAKGRVNKFNLNTTGCFDYGLVTVGQKNERCTIGFLNQYMYLEKNGKRIAQFPDLIIIISQENGLPIGSSQLREGQVVFVIVIPKEHLILGTEIDTELLFSQINELNVVNNSIAFIES